MPIKKEREYRALAAPLTAQSATKLIQTKGIMLVDGKVVDKNSLVVVKKIEAV